MIKFKINKRTKKPYNSYSVTSNNVKIGNYNQLDNTLRLDINKYIEIISKGEVSSKRFLQI
jgi:hypothetical protein